MNKMNVEALTIGSTIGMLDGVVKVASVTVKGDEVVVGVSIGRLTDRPFTYPLGAQVEVFNMPADVAPWYGV